MTTYSQFLSALAALPVEGVNRRYQTPPLSLNRADLPAQWVQAGDGESAAITLDGGQWPLFRAQLIIAVEALAQSVLFDSYGQAIEMMDNVHTALTQARLAKSRTVWHISLSSLSVADVEYLAVIAAVEASG